MENLFLIYYLNACLKTFQQERVHRKGLWEDMQCHVTKGLEQWDVRNT